MMKKVLISIAAFSVATGAALAAQKPATDSPTPANFNSFATSARAKLNQAGARKSPLDPALSVLGTVQRGGARAVPAHYDPVLGAVNFAWARSAEAPPAVGALKSEALVEARARSYLSAQRGALGLPLSALATAEAVDLQDTGHGPVVARFRQREQGLQVFNRQVSVMMDRAGRLVAVSGNFADDRALKAAPVFALGAPQAIVAAFANMGGTLDAGALSLSKKTGEYSWFTKPAIRSGLALSTSPRSKKVLFATADKQLLPAYYVELIGGHNGGGNLAFGYVVSAKDGAILFRKDLIAYEGGTAAFSYRVFADASDINQPFDSPLGNGNIPFFGGPSDSLPRVSATANLVTLVSGPIKSKDAWLAAGATTTTGNNADAYLDSGPQVTVPINSPVPLPTGDGYVAGSGDVRATATPAGSAVFDHAIKADDDPSGAEAQQAAIVNLFYMNNWLHDWWYDNGFDEKAGNGQTSNYGRGGEEGDAILAEGQDGSGRNNANMQTPADGGSPRMQMYLFDGPIKGEVCQRTPNNNCLTTPAGTGPTYKFAGASFGPNTFDVEGAVAVANDRSDPSTNGCNDDAPPIPDPTGLGLTLPVPSVPDTNLLRKIALIDRGSCSFTTKEQFAMLSGATALVVINNGDGDPSTMGNADIPINVGLPTTDMVYTVPAVMIRKDVGEQLKAMIAAGVPVTMHLQRLASIDYDGTLDELVIAHEFFHHVSNRLVNDGSGLTNMQGGGMGEGWSDFDSLLLSVRPEDQLLAGNALFQAPIPTGFYVIPSDYFGIRRQPYSTDFTKNSLTFKHIQDGTPLDPQAPIGFGADGATNSEVHNTGEVWTTMLWQCYAGILDTTDNDSFEAKRERMKDYIISGLKMTPSSPTILAARDGVLASAYATNYKDYMACARGFAKRGAGVYAVGPASDSTDNVGVTEDGIALIANYPVVKTEFVYDKACDADTILDSNESGTMKFTFRNTGTFVSDVPLTAKVTTTATGITFGNGGAITLPAVLKYGDTATVSLPVSAGTLPSSPYAVPLTVTFDAVAGSDPAVQQPSAAVQTIYANQDGALRTFDDMQDSRTSLSDWTVENAGSTWTVKAVDATAGTGMAWFVEDPAVVSDSKLTTPFFAVPAGGSFSMDFDHFFEFEAALLPFNDPILGLGATYDGGVIEVSVDGGVWTDAVAYGATFTKGSGYNGTVEALGGRDGFVDTNDAVEPMTLDFADKLAGHQARLRFRSASDSAGAGTGWTIDNVKLNSITTPVFNTLLPEDGICTVLPLVVDAGEPQTVDEHPSATDASFPVVKLVGTVGAGIPAGRLLKWMQTGGPAAVLSGDTTLTPSFTAPKVAADTPLTFKLMATDTDMSTGVDTVIVTIRDVNLRPIAGAGADQTVQTGKAVTLDGSSSSDPDGDAPTYAWNQTSGPPVTLAGATTAKPSFTPSTDGSYGFTVKVSDPKGESATDVVNVVSKADAPVVVPPVVVPPVTTAPATTESSRLGGGAFGPWLLLPLLSVVALRRRKQRTKRH